MLLFWSLTAVTEVLSVVLVLVSDDTYIIQLWRRSFVPLVMVLNYVVCLKSSVNGLISQWQHGPGAPACTWLSRDTSRSAT